MQQIKNKLLLSLIVLLTGLVSYQSYAQNKKTITYDDLFSNGTFEAKSVPGFRVLSNGIQFSKIDQEGISVYHLKTGLKIKTIFENNKDIGRINAYTFSDDEKKILLFTERASIYRRSALYKVYVYDTESKNIERVDEKDKIMHATFDPTGNKVAYVKGNNLFIQDLKTKKLVQITNDGKQNEIINGNCDWVYEEEFAFTKAFQWSPDGKYLAYYRFDERNVPMYTMEFYEKSSIRPIPYSYKYPKAGDENSVVSIHVFNTEEGTKKELISANKPDHGLFEPEYIPRIQWTPKENNLCVFLMNRWQNQLELKLINVATAATSSIYKEENKYFVDINNGLTPNNNLNFLNNGHALIINSERDGYNHLYVWDWKKQELKQITSGKWDVDKLVKFDTKNNQIYYTAAKTSPMDRSLYRIDLNGKNDICITPEKGYHQISGFAAGLYFLDAYSTAEQAPVYRLIDNNGKTIRILEDNKELEQTMRQYNLGKVEFFTIPNADGYELNAYKILPPDFDKNKKYPVLMYQYSGPGSQQVLNKFPLGNFFWHQMLAQKGYIIVCVDGIGTGMRGWEFQNKTYLQLGKYESHDQIDAAKYLGNLPYVDASRIGIWGWSYGGFMSSTCFLKGNGVFKAAIAVAPVTNWRYYDNIYTERYMRRPQDNPLGYDNNAPELMESSANGKLLIVHGITDDNVHFQNSVMLVKNLTESNINFESAFYPNQNHSINAGKARENLYKRMTEFILRAL